MAVIAYINTITNNPSLILGNSVVPYLIPFRGNVIPATNVVTVSTGTSAAYTIGYAM